MWYYYRYDWFRNYKITLWPLNSIALGTEIFEFLLFYSFFFFFTLPVLTTYILMATASLIHASCGYSLRLGGSNNRNGAHGPLGSSTSFSCSCCSSTNLNFSSGNWSLSSLRCSFLFLFSSLIRKISNSNWCWKFSAVLLLSFWNWKSQIYSCLCDGLMFEWRFWFI